MNRLILWLAAISMIFVVGMTEGLYLTVLRFVWWAFLGWLALWAVVFVVIGVVFLLLALGDFLDRVFGE